MTYNMEHHLFQKQKKLLNSISGKSMIYLDTNYWITLKDQASNNLDNRDFFNLISYLHKSGKAVFPISEVTFYEVRKRANVESLKKTLQVIDEFSQGITFLTRHDLIRRELKTYLSRLEAAPLNSHFLTKLFFAIHPDFLNSPFSKANSNPMSEQFMIDSFWNTSLVDNNDLLSMRGHKPFVFNDNTEYLDEQKKIHENENNTFQEMFLSEVNGIIEEYEHIINEVFLKMSLESPHNFKLWEQELETHSFKKVIFNEFEMNNITNELPSLSIIAGLFANNRWDKTKKSNKNDTMDFLHASFALPYCDYFFTEKSMGSSLTQKHLAYDKLYSCNVKYKENDVLKVLESIAN
jgi:hypothetical protein